MFIDTHSIESMRESMKAIFGEDDRSLGNGYIDVIPKEKQIKHVIKSGMIDSILFFHLSRRLHTDDNTVLCLPDLLLTENAFSLFLESHGVTFARENEHIKMFYKGVEQNIRAYNSPEANRLSVRLGFVNVRRDFCVNGFAFREGLLKHYYAEYLSDVPELIKDICVYLDNDGIGYDYLRKSKYYCLEYRVPTKYVIFDELGENESEEDKVYYFINKVCQCLRDHQSGDVDSMLDENEIIRLPDNISINREWFVTKEIVKV